MMIARSRRVTVGTAQRFPAEGRACGKAGGTCGLPVGSLCLAFHRKSMGGTWLSMGSQFPPFRPPSRWVNASSPKTALSFHGQNECLASHLNFPLKGTACTSRHHCISRAQNRRGSIGTVVRRDLRQGQHGIHRAPISWTTRRG
jgi:hypothetical protein